MGGIELFVNADPVGLAVLPESNAVRPEDVTPICDRDGVPCGAFNPPQMMMGCHR